MMLKVCRISSYLRRIYFIFLNEVTIVQFIRTSTFLVTVKEIWKEDDNLYLTEELVGIAQKEQG